MIWESLAHELKQYFRRLWPYALALVVMSVFAFLMIYFDKNTVELTGPMAAIGWFVITALIFFIRSLIHAYKSFSKNLSSATTEKPRSIKIFLWAQIIAFMIFIMITALLLLACVSAFAWKSVGQMFLNFQTDWYYFIEFVLYLVIFSATLYIIPTTWIVAFRFGKYKKLSLTVGIITFLICFYTIPTEALLLVHSSSTNMLGVWAFTMSCLVIFIAVDIGMYLLTYRMLKNTLCGHQNT